MSFLYIGTFGSFIGYSAAMPLLIKLNFWNQPLPTVPGIGINFAYYAFLGALVGSIARPFGGWLADKYGGARVTLWTFVAMIVGTLGVIYTLTLLTAVPKPPAGAPAPDPATFQYSDAVVDGRQRQLRHLPVVPRGLPVRLRGDRDRQRLDVPDDPADPGQRGEEERLGGRPSTRPW